MVNLQTGKLVLDDGGRFGPTLALPAFLSSTLAHETREDHGGPGHTNFYIGRRSLNGAALSIVLYYDGDRLESASMALLGGSARPEDEWSEHAALASKARHDAWLAQELGPPPYTYPWGVIESGYDPRSVSSSIVVRYHR